MLKSLTIRNFVLIEQLDITFDSGFSVITGETGAGKSIILGALGLVLGQRADGKSIKNGTDKCLIEAVFDIQRYQLEAFFIEHDLEYDAETCILRRELYPSGKSRAFVNDSPVSLTVMKELGGRLVDIHSQHQNLLLGDTRFQLRVVDVMAENETLLTLYREEYSHYQSLRRELKQLTEKATATRQEEDYIRFQLQQLEEADLQAGEQENLEQEQDTLSHAEEIKGSLYRMVSLLDGEEGGALSLLKEALSTAESLERYYPDAREMVERIRSAYIDLDDLASDADSRKEDIEYNPARMDWVNDRLNTIYSLEQKHRVQTVEDLIALRDRMKGQLQEIDSYDEQIIALKEQVKGSYDKLIQQAVALGEQRRAAAKVIAEQLIEMVAPLGMPHVRFSIDFQQKAEPGSDGMDEVCFLFSANKQAPLQPVAETASGGEIARLMLCVKAMIAGITALPAIIFDEIDTGVSGDIADKMGDIMQQLGEQMQVLTITHLPQIASKGQAHYYVYKEDTTDRTVTHLCRLTDEERVREIARMLSGSELTEASLANAKELLKQKK